MTKTINREICSHCGQTINRREIVLTKIMVNALYRIFQYCKVNKEVEKNVAWFTREEIRPYLLKMGSETIVATFGDWKFLSGGMVLKQGRGNWGLDMVKADAFFRGKWNVPLRVAKKGKSNIVEELERGSVWEVKGVEEFLTPEGQMTIFYRT
jgi:hypothetical protein